MKVFIRMVFGTFVVLIIISILPDSAEVKANKALEAEREKAYFVGRNLIEKQLKAPSTAKFGWITDCPTILVNEQDRWWTTSCFVDSQNSFGAMIRTKYWVTSRFTGKEWLLVDYAID